MLGQISLVIIRYKSVQSKLWIWVAESAGWVDLRVEYIKWSLSDLLCSPGSTSDLWSEQYCPLQWWMPPADHYHDPCFVSDKKSVSEAEGCSPPLSPTSPFIRSYTTSSNNTSNNTTNTSNKTTSDMKLDNNESSKLRITLQAPDVFKAGGDETILHSQHD